MRSLLRRLVQVFFPRTQTTFLANQIEIVSCLGDWTMTPVKNYLISTRWKVSFCTSSRWTVAVAQVICMQLSLVHFPQINICDPRIHLTAEFRHTSRMHPDRPLSDDRIRLICWTIGILSFVLNVIVFVSLLKLRPIYARNIFIILIVLQVIMYSVLMVLSIRLSRYSISSRTFILPSSTFPSCTCQWAVRS